MNYISCIACCSKRIYNKSVLAANSSPVTKAMNYKCFSRRERGPEADEAGCAPGIIPETSLESGSRGRRAPRTRAIDGGGPIVPHSSRLHRHTAARPGKNLRAGSTRVSTHRCGGSCTTGCARCGWWTWPSLLRLGATSRRALRRGLAAMELREQETGFLLFQLPTETKNFDRPIFL